MQVCNSVSGNNTCIYVKDLGDQECLWDVLTDGVNIHK